MSLFRRSSDTRQTNDPTISGDYFENPIPSLWQRFQQNAGGDLIPPRTPICTDAGRKRILKLLEVTGIGEELGIEIDEDNMDTNHPFFTNTGQQKAALSSFQRISIDTQEDILFEEIHLQQREIQEFLQQVEGAHAQAKDLRARLETMDSDALGRLQRKINVNSTKRSATKRYTAEMATAILQQRARQKLAEELSTVDLPEECSIKIGTNGKSVEIFLKNAHVLTIIDFWSDDDFCILHHFATKAEFTFPECRSIAAPATETADSQRLEKDGNLFPSIKDALERCAAALKKDIKAFRQFQRQRLLDSLERPKDCQMSIGENGIIFVESDGVTLCRLVPQNNDSLSYEFVISGELDESRFPTLAKINPFFPDINQLWSHVLQAINTDIEDEQKIQRIEALVAEVQLPEGVFVEVISRGEIEVHIAKTLDPVITLKRKGEHSFVIDTESLGLEEPEARSFLDKRAANPMPLTKLLHKCKTAIKKEDMAKALKMKLNRGSRIEQENQNLCTLIDSTGNKIASFQHINDVWVMIMDQDGEQRTSKGSSLQELVVQAMTTTHTADENDPTSTEPLDSVAATTASSRGLLGNL